MSNNSHDRWLLPRRQTELPARGLLPEETLHHRRELTFLALAALFLTTSCALVMLGASRVVDVSAVLARVAPGIELPTALLVPLGVLPFAASFIAVSLVCHLLGRRRARALVGVGVIAVIALVGLMRVADLIDGGDAFGAALAFAAAHGVGHASNVLVFDRLRGRSVFLRIVVTAIVANALAWAAFAGVLHAGGGYVLAPIARGMILALTVGSAAYSLVLVLVLATPAALTARGLAVALRVGRDLFGTGEPATTDEPARSAARPAFAGGSAARKLPPALIVDVDSDDEVARPRARRPSLQPYSSAEMRFFTEGDALGD